MYKPKTSAVLDQGYFSFVRLNGLAKIQSYNGSPEGNVPGTRGDVLIDTGSSVIWVKTTGDLNTPGTLTGWVPIGIGVVDAEFGSVGWSFPEGPEVVQTGSGAGFVNVVGASTLDSAEGFSSAGAGQLTYTGEGGVFFISALMNTNNPEAEQTNILLRLAVDGVAVERSTNLVIIASDTTVIIESRAQVELSMGQVITAQINNSTGTLDLSSTYFRLQAHRVGN